jgi:hypothetical protein
MRVAHSRAGSELTREQITAHMHRSLPAATAAPQHDIRGPNLASPPQTDRVLQLCMVPDTPVSESGRDTAPEPHVMGNSLCGTGGVPLGSAGISGSPHDQMETDRGPETQGIEIVRSLEIRGLAPQDTEEHLSLKQQHQHESIVEPAGLQNAAEHTEGVRSGSMPQLLLDLHLSGSQVVASQPEAAQALHSDALDTMPQQHSLAVDAVPKISPGTALAAAVAAAAAVAEGMPSSCLKQNSDRETPLVQCAQPAPDMSTSGASARAAAALTAQGASHKVLPYAPVLVP